MEVSKRKLRRLVMKRYFSKEHEWVLLDNNDTTLAKVGITDHAQESLGDIVYVEMPEIGTQIVAGDEVAVVESAKAASDIYAPITGKVAEINTELEETPDLINKSPLEDGWIFTVHLDKSSELQELMSEDEYEAYIKEL